MAMVERAQVGDRPATQSNAALVSVPDARLYSFFRSATPYVRADHVVEASELSPAFGFITPRFMYTQYMMYLQRPTDPPPRLDMTITALRLTHPPTHARLIPRIEIINDLFGISRNRGAAAAAAGAARLSDREDLLSCRCWCASAGAHPSADRALTHFFLVWWLIVTRHVFFSPSGSRTKARSEPRAVVGGFQVR